MMYEVGRRFDEIKGFKVFSNLGVGDTSFDRKGVMGLGTGGVDVMIKG